MIVVSNATPLIGLASINRFDLLQKLFGEIIISQAVYDEVMVTGHVEGGAKIEASSASWVKIIPVHDNLAVEVLLDELDRGEAETIVLARELNADLVLMDEKKGRRKLSQMAYAKIGTVGILLKAKQERLISQLEPDLTRLRTQGFSISQPVIDGILKETGEKQ